MYTPNKERYNVFDYNKCGKSGLKLPPLSLGLWHNFGKNGDFNNMRKICQTAFDCGITHFDIANNYGPPAGMAEINFGKILKKDFSCYRDELIISTKAGYTMWDGPYGDFGSRKYLLASLDQSLKRLGVDYVDIFYHHRIDKDTPLEETMGALATAVNSGKALYVGLSNYDGETLKQATKILDDYKVPFIINQNSYSILNRTIEENGLKQQSVALGRGIIAFCPLAQGLLTDRYLYGIPNDSRVKTDGRFLNEQSITQQKVDIAKRLNEIAKNREQTLAQMSLAWILKDGEVTSVLFGASNEKQVIENVGAIKNTQFSSEELALIDQIVFEK